MNSKYSYALSVIAAPDRNSIAIFYFLCNLLLFRKISANATVDKVWQHSL